MLATAINRPNVRGTDIMQLCNARVTAAVRMLLNKAVSAVWVDGVKVAGKPWEVQALSLIHISEPTRPY